MDIDRFILARSADWERLEHLVGQARRPGRSIDDVDVEELLALYQRCSAHLAYARTHFSDAALISDLSSRVAEARSFLYRRRRSPLAAVRRFVTRSFPAAVWLQGRAIAVATLLLLVPAFAAGVWLTNDTDTLDRLIDRTEQHDIAEEQFAEYYRSEAASRFQLRVTANNVRVAATATALGVIPVVGVARILTLNGTSIGAVGAVMHRADAAEVFWGLITPHGLLEICSIIIAGGAGLAISWAVLVPGDRPRRVAVGEAVGRAMITLIGLLGAFAVAGFIEAFVTPSGLPVVARVGIGVLALAAFLAYLLTFGRIAVAEGYRGHRHDAEHDPRATAADQPAGLRVDPHP